MEKFNNWGKSVFYEIEDGDYSGVIANAKLTLSKNGDEMLQFELDIAEGAKKNHFKKKYEQANGKIKWPLILFQLTRGKAQYFFEQIIRTIEKSNPNYDFEKTGFNEKTLIGKSVGMHLKNVTNIGTNGKSYPGYNVTLKPLSEINPLPEMVDTSAAVNEPDLPF